ncbi:hypothetical protein [Vibrio fluvialis]|uniref:defense against restriction DarA-related protein n=2 Tax=Vibrio fluvialis TaxID=676 RepID=UPI001EE9FC23|nr:hypothetical protein [Vibrio fluvialis]MCG6387481.1 hypothetical protein [Vibrio fluvialis]
MFLPKNEIAVVNRIDHFLSSLSEAQINAVFSSDEHDLLLESVAIADIELAYYPNADHIPAMMLEAIKAKAARLETRVIGFSNTLNKYLGPSGIEVTGREISKPKKSGAVAVQVAKILLSDGQSVSLVFHAPDNDPLKINADDTLIAFRFLVNSRDVTHAVAPAGGRDVSRSQMALALSNLVEKNSTKFAAAQEKNQQQKQAMEDAQAKIETLESEIGEKADQLDSVESEIEQKQKRIKTISSQIANHNDIQAELRKQLESKFVSGTGENPGGNPIDKVGQTKLDSRLLSSARFKSAADAVKKDGNGSLINTLMSIAGIDGNDPKMAGYDRSLFVSSFANKLKTLKRQGMQTQVNNALTMLAEYASVADKPAFTKRHSIWKLGEVNDVPEAAGLVTTEDDAAGEMFWYGLQARPYGMGNTPSDAQEVKVLNAEEAAEKFPYAGRAVRHGAIAYAVQLTPEQVSGFELKPLSEGQTEDESLADSNMAETIARIFLDDWMEANGVKVITQAQMDEIKALAQGDFKSAFSKLLRQQEEFLNREKDETAYKAWNASLALITPQMLEDEADSMNVLISLTRERNEKVVAALSELIKGKTLPDGWELNKSGLELSASNIDKVMSISVEVESPLSRLGDVNPFGEYDIRYHDNGHFLLTYSEGSPVEGAENLSDWGQIKDALQAAYLADMDDKDLIDRLIGSDYEEDFNDVRKANGLPPVSGLDEDGELNQHTDNQTNVFDSIKALLTSVREGVLGLKEARLMLSDTLYPLIPDDVKRDINGRNAVKNKVKWLSSMGVWLDNAKYYDPNAPIVQTSQGTVNFNVDTYDVIDELGLFGKPLVAAAKAKPQNLIQYFSDASMFSEEDAEKLTHAVKVAYMKPEPTQEPEPVAAAQVEPAPVEPEPAPEAAPQLKKRNDIVTMGSGRFVIDRINPQLQLVTLVDLENDEPVTVTKEALEMAGIYIEGLSLLPVSESEEVAQLKELLKDLPTGEWFDDKGKMSFQGQDDIFDALRADGYSVDDAIKQAQKIRFEHNSGAKPFIGTYTDSQLEPEQPPVVEPEQGEVNSEEQAHAESLRGIRDFSGEATLELVEQFQAEIEQAYAYFEGSDTLAENNDLLESAFAKLVEMQSEVTV